MYEDGSKCVKRPLSDNTSNNMTNSRVNIVEHLSGYNGYIGGKHIANHFKQQFKTLFNGAGTSYKKLSKF